MRINGLLLRREYSAQRLWPRWPPISRRSNAVKRCARRRQRPATGYGPTTML